MSATVAGGGSCAGGAVFAGAFKSGSAGSLFSDREFSEGGVFCPSAGATAGGSALLASDAGVVAPRSGFGSAVATCGSWLEQPQQDKQRASASGTETQAVEKTPRIPKEPRAKLTGERRLRMML